MTCTECRGTRKRWVRGHSFNPALGHPWAMVDCDCVTAEIEEAQRAYRARLVPAEGDGG